MISLSDHNPELLCEWDYEKNKISPDKVSYGTNKKAWWICPSCGNSYKAEIAHRVNGTSCPKCFKKYTG